MIEAIFAPQSVAIVGASPDPSRRGCPVLRNIVQNGYAFPYHPIGNVLLDTPDFPSIQAFPEPNELAAIVIPSDTQRYALMRCVTLRSLSYSELCLLDAAQGDGHGNPLCRLD